MGCKKKLADPFPASGAVAGWDKGDKTQTYDAANLYEYIDGGAEQYISAGVVGVSTSDYKFQGSLEATVDVYTMKSADGAKTIFDADPPTSDSKSVPLGDAARLYGQSVVFRKGRPWYGSRLSRLRPVRATLCWRWRMASRASCRTDCREQFDGSKGQKHGGAGCKTGVSL